MKNKIRYFIPKVKGRLNLYWTKMWKYLPVERLCLKGLGQIPSKTSFLLTMTNLIGDIKVNELLKITNSSTEDIVKYAEHAIRHEFNYLGSGWVKNDPIKWNIDLKTGDEWPYVFFTEVRSFTIKGSDIKSPWELSRGHHLLWMGLAFSLTGDNKYAHEVVSEIKDWIEKNPFMYGVNWVCPMDVAIRAVNWMHASFFVSSSSYFSPDFVEKLYKSLYLHGVFIYNNLEKGTPYSNNHYTSNLAGLLYLGALFNDKKYGRKWYRYAKSEFFKETRQQMMPSGIHYEKSISYHRLMVELTAYPLAMMIRTGDKIPEDIISIIRNMYNYVNVYIKPNGKAPLLADNDNGRFLPFSVQDYQKHGYLLDPNSIDNLIVFNGIKVDFPPVTYEEYMNYEDAKIAFIKKCNNYLIANNSDYSRYTSDNQLIIGTHTHNDQLSFEFSIGNNDIFVDPGAYLYTSNQERRNEFRSTCKHNTIIVDDEEQNELSKTDAFIIKKNVKTEPFVTKNGRCSGVYSTIKGGLSHRRDWVLGDNSLMIEDNLKKSGTGHRGFMYYHLAPGQDPILTDECISLNNSDLFITISFEGAGIKNISILKDTVSPSYGILHASSTIAVEFYFDEQVDFKTIVSWK